MFKLIKIQNSGVNVPEPMLLGKPATLVVKTGEALIISDGLLAKCPATTIPTHVSLSNGAYGDTDVIVFEVNSNMIFETTVNADPSMLDVGAKVTIANAPDGSATRVSATTTAGVATIVDLMGAEKVGDKLNVKFN